MTVTIYNVAKEACVFMVIVSRVINGNQNVEAETKNKVNEIIERLNYRPNAVARGSASKKTTTVGVTIPDILNIYYSQLVRRLEDIATVYKYHSVISNSDNDPEKEKKIFNNLLGGQVDDIIFLGDIITGEMKELINQSSVPVVVSGANGKDIHITSVDIDFTEVAKEITGGLVEKGVKSFTLVGGEHSKKAQEDVLEGLTEVLNESSLQLGDTLNYSGTESYKESVKAFAKMKGNLPGAILYTSGEEAIGIMHSAMDAGIKIPEELQIISFNNTRLVEMVRPQLSSVIQPLYDIDAVGMRLLTEYMNDEKMEGPNIILPHRIEY